MEEEGVRKERKGGGMGARERESLGKKRVKCLIMGGTLFSSGPFSARAYAGNDMVRSNKYSRACSHQTMGRPTCGEK